MKKIKNYKLPTVLILLFTAISLNAQNLEKSGSDFFKNYTYYLSLNNEEIVTGTKLSFSMAEMTIAAKNSGFNYGLSLFTENYFPNFPCKFLIGNLSPGGGLSKLSSPGLSSSSSGFSSCYSKPNFITANIPSFNSFSNPISTFLEIRYKKEKSIFEEAGINCIYDIFSQNTSMSTKLSFNFFENFKIKNILLFSIFTTDGETPVSWYGSPYYKADKLLCFSSAIDINLFLYSGHFTVFFYETPFGKIECIYKTENEINTKYFKIGAGFYINNSPNIISPKSSRVEPAIEGKTNIQFSYPFITKNKNEIKFKLGLLCFGNIPLEKNADDLDCCISSSFDFPNTSISGNIGLNYEINPYNKNIKPETYSIKLKNSWKIGFFNPSFSLYSKYYISDSGESSENNEILHINADTKYYKTDFACTIIDNYLHGNCSFSFYYKNNDFTDMKLKIGLNSDIKLKDLTIILKINGELCI